MFLSKWAFQRVEIVKENTLAWMLPSCLHHWPQRWVMEHLHPYPEGARVDIHVCPGDCSNETPVKTKVEKVLVSIVNRVLAEFPNHLRLEYVHRPFAEACRPSSTDPLTYAPLKNAQLPEGTRFVAGFCHEKISLEDHDTILKAIESATGHPVDIACSCGLGRRSPEVAKQLLETMKHTANLPFSI